VLLTATPNADDDRDASRDDARYAALTARDARFDGVFFVGVSTTGIYCRPICPAKTPGRTRCTFYDTPAQAERAGFRACFRCRPELAPGTTNHHGERASVDALDVLVAAATQRIAEGALNERSLDDLATELGVSARHLRRALETKLGVSPVELAQSRRLALAKQLLQDTSLAITDIAFAAGFGSVRRFNAAFDERMGVSPSNVRRAHGAADVSAAAKGGAATSCAAAASVGAAKMAARVNGGAATSRAAAAAAVSVGAAKTRAGARGGAATSRAAAHVGAAKVGAVASGPAELTLRLDYRAPYDWARLLGFLRGRAIPGVEIVGDDSYRSVVHIDGHVGEIRVRQDPGGRTALRLTVSPTLLPVLMPLVARVRRMFDLDAHPDAIARVLGRDRVLAKYLAARPGLRVPGAIDPFEASIRALLGQQVTVVAATTLAGRFAAQFGAAYVGEGAGEGGRGGGEGGRGGGGGGGCGGGGGGGLTHRFPTPAEVAKLTADRIAKIGMPGRRGAAIHALACALVAGTLRLDAAADLDAFVEKLVEMPGIGPWTAHYLAMRALHLPDAFPAMDLGVQKALGMSGKRAAEERAEAWRPYRAYAVLHLWTGLGERE
jgi:AraC family transcriptional regulator of adaptative response / DNA-3-methyladenine glycosylase II